MPLDKEAFIRGNVNSIIQGDTLEILKTFPDEMVDSIITSPPYYGLRDYQTAKWEGGNNLECDHQIPESERDPKYPDSSSHIIRFNRDACYKCGAKRIDQQIGLEKSLTEYLDKMLAITQQLFRVLKKTGTMWWNHGDSYSTRHPSGTTDAKTGWRAGKMWQGEGRKQAGRAFGGNIPDKSQMMQNYRLAIQMIDEQGWILRNQIIWHKPNVMPSSVKDRFTVDFEPVFFFSKSKKYWFERQYEPVQETSVARLYRAVSNKHKWLSGANGQSSHTMSQPRPNRSKEYKRYEKSNAPHEFQGGDHLVSPFNPILGRNKRTVWKIATKPFKEKHFAVFPEDLIIPMIKAGCPAGGLILDPFGGAMTTCAVAKKLQRNFIAIELNPDYIEIGKRRLALVPEPML